MIIKKLWYIRCTHRHHKGKNGYIEDAGYKGLSKVQFIEKLLKLGWRRKTSGKESYVCPKCKWGVCKQCKIDQKEQLRQLNGYYS